MGGLGVVLWCILLSCGANHDLKVPRSARPETVAPARASASSAPPTAPEAKHPFSGEIVYRQTAFHLGLSVLARDLGNLHYFVSGRNWKHVDDRGEMTALYEPESHLIHYFKPERRTVSASESKGPVTFVALRGKKNILGRECSSFRMTTKDDTTVICSDPTLYVDPKLHSEHHWGYWAETLAFSHGGLSLWSETEMTGGTFVSEAIAIRYIDFEPGFWAVPVDVTGQTDATK